MPLVIQHKNVAAWVIPWELEQARRGLGERSKKPLLLRAMSDRLYCRGVDNILMTALCPWQTIVRMAATVWAMPISRVGQPVEDALNGSSARASRRWQ